MMKALINQGPGQISLEERPVPMSRQPTVLS